MLAELLADVGADARRAGEIIHGIHHLVRKGESVRRLINLNEVARIVLRLLNSDLLAHETGVETDLQADLPMVEGDAVQLQQVLLNLIMNAIEAMRTMPLARRHLVVTSRSAADGSVIMTVRDHGVGLPPEGADKVFTRFYSTKPNGMGMGLAIARSIVEGHGGALRAESIDEGAEFVVRLPGSIARPKVA